MLLCSFNPRGIVIIFGLLSLVPNSQYHSICVKPLKLPQTHLDEPQSEFLNRISTLPKTRIDKYMNHKSCAYLHTTSVIQNTKSRISLCATGVLSTPPLTASCSLSP